MYLCLVILLVNNSLSTRRYNNPIFFSDMLGESVFRLNLLLNPTCGKRPGIDISLMMSDRFFVSFQATIGTGTPISLSSFVYNRRRCGTLSSSLLGFTGTPYSSSLALLNTLFSRRGFFLSLFFFGIYLCGPTLLGFSVGRIMTSVKITSSSRLVLE